MRNGIMVVLNPDGVRKILKHEDTKKELLRRAQKIKGRAGDVGYSVDVREGANRTRVEIAAVSHKARLDESRKGNLRRAVGD